MAPHFALDLSRTAGRCRQLIKRLFAARLAADTSSRRRRQGQPSTRLRSKEAA